MSSRNSRLTTRDVTSNAFDAPLWKRTTTTCVPTFSKRTSIWADVPLLTSAPSISQCARTSLGSSSSNVFWLTSTR